MKLSSINNTTPFKGALNNKAILHCLEKISEHGATFGAAASFLGAICLRPLAVSITPKTNEDNKKYIMANSISSGLIKLGITAAITLPIENAIKKIDRLPFLFLNKETISNLKGSEKFISYSKDYKFATQILKQGTNFLTILPKSFLTVALIPIITDKLFSKKEKQIKNKKKDLTFRGNIIPKCAAKIINKNSFQNFVKKFSKNDTNIARNTSVGIDILLTLSSIFQTKKSKKIDTKRKKPLIYNNILSTAASILMGCSIDKIIQNNTKNFIEKFKQANLDNPKLPKYIEGINILRPTIIFALVYYGFLPILTTFLADKFNNRENT